MKPSVSICLPVCNGEKHLRQSIESVLNQTFADFELLISDDCSKDASAEIIQGYRQRDSRIRFQQNPASKGRFANYNELLRLARGSFVKPFEQDDVLQNYGLASCVEILEADPGCMLVSTASKVINEEGRDISLLHAQRSITDVFGQRQKIAGRQLAHACFFPLTNLIGEASTVMFRASAIGSGFDENLLEAGELEYWLRIVVDGSFYFINRQSCSIRHHLQSASAANAISLRRALDILRIGRSYSGLLQQFGRSEQEFYSANLQALSFAVKDLLRAGKLSIDELRNADIASFERTDLTSLERTTKNMQRALADMADFRELCFRMMIMLGNLGSLAAEKNGFSLLTRNEKLIYGREDRLRNLLSSESWRSTRALREINRHFTISRSNGEDLCLNNSEPGAKFSSLENQKTYLKFLRRQIMRVVSSRSWKLTRILRSGAQPDFRQKRQTASWPAIFISRQAEPEADLLDLGSDLAGRQLTAMIPKPLDRYEAWMAVNQWNSRCEIHLRERLAASENTLPAISVIMPVFNPNLQFLEKAVDSLRRQIYDRWQLCIADDASSDPAVRAYLEIIALDPKVNVIFREQNGHISEASNSAAALAQADYLLFLDQDDELSEDALAEVALYIARHPDTDFLYSDNDKIDVDGNRYDPHFKPDWSPETLLSYMYACQVMVVRRELFEALGGMRPGYEGSQDHDLALRLGESAKHVGHIPKILYHWRSVPGSTGSSGNNKPYAFEAARKAVEDALARRGSAGRAVQHEWAQLAGAGYYSSRFPDQGPSVSIIIPTRNAAGLLKQCLESLPKTLYQNYQVLLVDNDSDDPETLAYLQSVPWQVARIANRPGQSFNYAFLMNRAAELVESEYLVFLNNDTQVLSPEWLSSMLGYAQLPEVGAVGALLYYPDARIQHAGVALGMRDGLCGHAYRDLSPGQWGHSCHNSGVARNYAAVTAACMATARKHFVESGGFDEKNFPVAYSDVDYCHRLIDRGCRVVYSPEAKLIHHEGGIRGQILDPSSAAAYRSKYRKRNDPYFNPNFSRQTEFFEVEPRHVTTDAKHSLKVLVYTHNLNLEGAPKVQLAVVRYLKAQGIIEPVVISRMDGPLRNEYESSGIPVQIKAPSASGKWTAQSYRHWLNTLKELIVESGIELVYANTLLSFDAIDASHELALPSIWNIHESNPWYGHLSALSPVLSARAIKCLSYPYKVIFGSFATKQQYQDFDTQHNFTVIHNALEGRSIDSPKERMSRDAARELLNVATNDVVVFLLGTVCERKGQLDILEALRHMEEAVAEKLRVFIVGDANLDYSKELRSAASLLPQAVSNRVLLIPTTDEIELYYRAADIFVCTSREECYPLVILEAMANDLPIVTTPVFGISEQVAAGVNAEFYSPGDTRELASKLSKLVIDEPCRKAYGAMSSLVLASLCSEIEAGENFARIFEEAYFTSTPVFELKDQNIERDRHRTSNLSF